MYRNIAKLQAVVAASEMTVIMEYFKTHNLNISSIVHYEFQCFITALISTQCFLMHYCRDFK